MTRLILAGWRTTPTGIERVAMNYAAWLAGRDDIELQFVAIPIPFVLGISRPTANRYLDTLNALWAAGHALESGGGIAGQIAEFVRATDGLPEEPCQEFSLPVPAPVRLSRTRPREAWHSEGLIHFMARTPLGRVIGRARREGRPALYLNVTHARLEKISPFMQLKAHPNLKIVYLIHDVIPLDFPELSREEGFRQHFKRMRTIERCADGIIVNSAYTGDRLLSWLRGPPPPMETAFLGTEPRFLQQLPPPDGFASEPYFVVVGTIEARKNHLLLLNIWRRLAERGGRVPKLVIVGKRGWHTETVTGMLERLPVLKQHVLEAGALPDRMLDRVLRGATALLMPTFAEGFGMPLVEALGRGVPVIASDIPVFREIGQGVPELIDPLDGVSWIKAIVDYAVPHSPRRQAQVDRLPGFRPPTWADHFSIASAFFERVLGAGEQRPVALPPPPELPALSYLQ